MALKRIETDIAGVLVIVPDVYPDPRGFFMETYQSVKYRDIGVGDVFVQDNYSHSCQGTLRGLHYQLQHAQVKLIAVIRGAIYDAVVDIRRGSPTFGRSVGQVLSGENHYQLLVPRGFAHGFCVVSETADVFYKCTDFYMPRDEYGVSWSDPALGIDWPVQAPLLSERDRKYLPLAQIAETLLPAYEG